MRLHNKSLQNSYNHVSHQTAKICTRPNHLTVLFHPIEGITSKYNKLINMCSSNFLLIHDVKLKHKINFNTLDLMCEYYAEIIEYFVDNYGCRSITLCGWSFGGLISLEIYKKINRFLSNITLILIDSYHPKLIRKCNTPDSVIINEYEYNIRDNLTLAETFSNPKVNCMVYYFKATLGTPRNSGFEELCNNFTIHRVNATHQSILDSECIYLINKIISSKQ